MVNIFEADGIILHYDRRTILSDIYIKSTTGKITGLVGNNGSGKSSLMRIMIGELTPESKSLRINKQHILKPYQQKGAVNYLPQQSCLPKHLRIATIFKHFRASVDDFKNTFYLELNTHDRVVDIHVSTRRLIELYLFIKSPTMFTLMDEPFTHLSPVYIERVQTFLTTAKQHKGVILTDHNFGSLMNIADDLYVLNNTALKHQRDIETIDSYRSLFEL